MGCEDLLQFELFIYSLRSRPERDYALKTFSPIFCVSPRIEYILDHECCSATLRGPYFAETSLDRIFAFLLILKRATHSGSRSAFSTAMIINRLISLIFRT